MKTLELDAARTVTLKLPGETTMTNSNTLRGIMLADYCKGIMIGDYCKGILLGD